MTRSNSSSSARSVSYTHLDVYKRQITVNVVAPGFVLTDLTAGLSDELVQQTLAYIPLGRWGQAQEIAHAVAFLASDRASYITGAVLQVDLSLIHI